MKGDFPYGEQKILSQLPNVAVAKFGHGGFVARDNVTEADKEEAKKGLEMSRKAMLSHDYDVIILDEINVAIAWKLVDLNEVVELIQEKPENVELILTGRYADDRLIEMADLVTDMTKVKHPYDKGILARKGIDY
jgi:cob(I)alamin adenosyltransferase